MGVGLLHFRSFLFISIFLVFAVVVFLRVSRVFASLTLPSVGLGFLWWTASLPLSCLCGWKQWSLCPGFPQVWQSLFPSDSFRLVSPFVLGGTLRVVFFFYFFYLYIFFYNGFCYPLSTLPEHIHSTILFIRQSYL